ncbi:uncharacterized protein LOC111703205 [Eurytemora carolleeae]|uniref:uncharacterized protein LOC111703205 n=1 Tax=Eurytemora carolleeae TaxID=1294199 RepID=UPI000C77C4FC|nr:uncharacterized protein LOC111703205 [Eurytemora carolleeae]|eukprot:XP_023330855.1 uncharacterized protein LOC111703205 [Eurytemora affinis]
MKNYKQTFVAFFTEKRRVLKIDASSDKKSSDKEMKEDDEKFNMNRFYSKKSSEKKKGQGKHHWAVLRSALLFVSVCRRATNSKMRKEEREISEEQRYPIFLGQVYTDIEADKPESNEK